MTNQLEERLSSEMSPGPSTTTPTESVAFADQIINRVDRRARRHRALYTGTIAAFVAAISAMAWSARAALTVRTGDGTTPGQLASPDPAPEPADAAENASSAIEAAVQTATEVSLPTTIAAFAMLIGLPMLAALVSWRRPANGALSDLGRVGRSVVTMFLTFFTFVSLTGLISVPMAHQSAPNLITELHGRSWIALAMLVAAAAVHWLVRFDFSALRQAANRNIWRAVRSMVAFPLVFRILDVDTQFDVFLHSAIAGTALYGCYWYLPRTTPLRQSRKVIAGIAIAAMMATGVLLTYQVVYFPGGSMEPTIEIGSRGIVNRFDTDIERGDVVVIRYPDRADTFDQVRRVIGMGGDFVAGRDGQLFVNGAVPDYFISLEAGGTPLRDFDEVRVPVAELFLMGDNYSGSTDSRSNGTLSEGLVVGTLSEGIEVRTFQLEISPG